jgi:hypothetical protein
VEEYSHRDLTYSTDKLPAISGIAVAVSNNLGSYMAGLWSANIRECLGWKVIGDECRKAPREYRAPSWSWAAVDGRVSYSWESTDSLLELQEYAEYNPQVVGVRVIHKDPLNPYMTPLQGSSITLKGYCTGWKTLRTNHRHQRLVNIHADTLENLEILQQEGEMICMYLRSRRTWDSDTTIEIDLVIFTIAVKYPEICRRLGFGTLTLIDNFEMTEKELYDSYCWQRRTLEVF